jgi:hypothetical protein
MRQIILILLLTAGVAGVWQMVEGGGLQRLGEKVGVDLGGSRARSGPSWGDVANKVGEFADAERGLQQTVGGVAPEAPAGAN